MINIFKIGSDIIEVKVIEKNNKTIFFKKFKKEKVYSYIKTIYILKKLSKYDFVPKIINYNDKDLEIYMSFCGKICTVNNLPDNWINQLNFIRKILIKENILFIDWGTWEVYPFILNNVCIKDNKLYFIDFDCSFESSDKINNYFNRDLLY